MQRPGALAPDDFEHPTGTSNNETSLDGRGRLGRVARLGRMRRRGRWWGRRHSIGHAANTESRANDSCAAHQSQPGEPNAGRAIVNQPGRFTGKIRAWRAGPVVHAKRRI